MKIFVQTINKEKIILDIKQNEAINNIILSIKDNFFLEYKTPLLIYNETILDNKKRISDYNIAEESILVLLNQEEKSLKECMENSIKALGNTGITYKEIINKIENKIFTNENYMIYLFKQNEQTIYKINVENKNFFTFNNKPFYAIVNEIKNYKDNNTIKMNIIKKDIYENICCIEEIIEKCKNYEINNLFVFGKQNKKVYFKEKFNENILENIRNGVLNIYYEKNEKYKDYCYELPNIINNNKFKPKDLIEDFYDLFKYNDEKEEDKYFLYEETDERKKIFKFLEELILKEEINIFKFTGPNGCGKTTTLIKFSRTNTRVLYFNCKLFRVLEEEGKNEKVFNKIIKEFKRIGNYNEEFIKKSKLFFQKLISKKYHDIFFEIFKYVKEEKFPIIFILDQVNEKNIKDNIVAKYIEYIKENKTKIKLVICSSINNYEIQGKVIASIRENKSFENGICIDNQDYYYYCKYLYINKVEESDKLYSIYHLFGFKKKYIFLFKKGTDYHKIFNKTRIEIKNKINDFLKDNIYGYNISDIFLLIKNNINKTFLFTQFPLLNFVPLKYFRIKFDKNYFSLDYDFPYMKTIINKIINIEDCNNYFSNEKYQIEFLKGNIKGNYYEYSCKYQIEKSNYFCSSIDAIVELESIAKFDKIVEDIEDEVINKILEKNKIENNTDIDNSIKSNIIDTDKSIKSNIIDTDNNIKSNIIDTDNNIKSNIMDIDNNIKSNIIDTDNNIKSNIMDIDNSIKSNIIETDNKLNIASNISPNNFNDLNVSICLNERLFNTTNLFKIESTNKKQDNNNYSNHQFKIFKMNKKEKSKEIKEEEEIKEIDIFNKNIQNFKNLKEEEKKERLEKVANSLTFKDYQSLFPKDFQEEINPLFYDIEYYRENTEVNENIPELKKNWGENILLNQKNNQGESLDQALVFEVEGKKIFLGIQIKCYSPDTKGGAFTYETKAKIKEKCKNVIKGVEKLLNCHLSEWHYILILYYNKKDVEGEPNQFLIEHCKKNYIEYIFYDPNEKKFYDKNKNESPYFKVNPLSNLDTFSYNGELEIYSNYRDEKKKRNEKFALDFQEYINDGLNFFYQFNSLEEINESNLKNFFNNLGNEISNIIVKEYKKYSNFTFSIIFKKKVYYQEFPRPPKNLNIFAYINQKNNNYIFHCNVDKNIFGINYEKKK